MIADALNLLLHHGESWHAQLIQHVVLSCSAIALAIAIGIPAGALLTRSPRHALAVINIANLGRTIPSLAILALTYPLLGAGFAPAALALVALGVPPILIATYTGVREVDGAVSEAARGLGYTARERLLHAELPIASPVVLSGVRTASVQIVASATLASLIGAGGLGETIMAGLTNLRYDMLIAGALLVGILAMTTELGFAAFERRALPAGIRMLSAGVTPQPSPDAYRAAGGIDARRWQALLAVVVVCGALLIGLGSVSSRLVSGIGARPMSGGDGPLPTIRMGSKDFTEQLVMAELYAQALEAQGYPVERHLNLGATAVADAALKRGSIDMYPEYTGTALFAVLGGSMPTQGGGASTAAAMSTSQRADAVYRRVADGYGERGMELMAQTPFSNGNAIVVTKATADRLHLSSLSDLARVSGEINFGAVPGFDTRADGIPLLARTYGMHFASTRSFENGLKYRALLDGRIDAVYGFETDGQIARSKLVTLRDDRGAWPPYHAVPVVARKVMSGAGPAFAPTVNSVSALLDTATMQRLNDQVDHDKLDPADVARAFLHRHGLDRRGARPTVRVGSKDFTEQLVLGELYAQALEARGFPVERRLNLGATAVADSAVRADRIDLYPEYTGTSLAAVLKQRPRDGATAQQVYDQVRTGYARRKLDLLRATPFSNGNAIVVTSKTADRLGLRTLSDLAHRSGDLRFGAVPGFDTREDGLPLLERTYSMRFRDVRSFENGLKYSALLDGKIDAVYGFETDGQIAEHGLVVLRDDRRVWPPYQVAPVVSHAFMQQVGPDFAATIDHVSSLLDASTMRRLNSQVDHDKRDPSDVARTFLRRNHVV